MSTNKPVSPIDDRSRARVINTQKEPGEDGGKEKIGVGNSAETVISESDRLKLSNWKYKPKDEIYIKYKDVFDNPKYYNQIDGEINWPPNDGFLENPIDDVLKPGIRIDRHGIDTGSFVSPEGTPYEKRAAAPGTDTKPYSVFEVIEPIGVQAGKISPWFDEPGGGVQYILPDSIEELLKAKK